MAFEGIIGQLRVINKMKGDEETTFEVRKNPFLTGLSITMENNSVSSLSISLDFPYLKGIEVMNSNLFAFGNFVAVRFGYSDLGMMSPWFFGELAEGGRGLEISGAGLSGTINASTYGRAFLRLADMPKKAILPEELLINAASKIGYALEIAPDAKQKLIKKLHTWDGPLSNFGLIKQLCLTYALTFWFGLKESGAQSIPTLFIRSGKDLTSGVPVRKYVINGKFDPSKNVWPLLNYGPTDDKNAWNGRFPDASAAGVSAVYYDEDTGKVVTRSARPEDLDIAVSKYLETTSPVDVSNNGLMSDSKLASGEMVMIDTTPVKVDEGKSAAVAAEVDQAASDTVMAGSAAQEALLTTIGSPFEMPGNMVLVCGCSDMFDGSYLVRSVTHTIGPGAFDTSIKVYSRGVVGKAGPLVVPPGGAIRKDDPGA